MNSSEIPFHTFSPEYIHCDWSCCFVNLLQSPFTASSKIWTHLENQECQTNNSGKEFITLHYTLQFLIAKMSERKMTKSENENDSKKGKVENRERKLEILRAMARDVHHSRDDDINRNNRKELESLQFNKCRTDWYKVLLEYNGVMGRLKRWPLTSVRTLQTGISFRPTIFKSVFINMHFREYLSYTFTMKVESNN